MVKADMPGESLPEIIGKGGLMQLHCMAQNPPHVPMHVSKYQQHVAQPHRVNGACQGAKLLKASGVLAVKPVAADTNLGP